MSNQIERMPIPDFIMALIKEAAWYCNPDFDSANRIDGLRANALDAIKIYKEAKQRKSTREARIKAIKDWIATNETKPNG